MIETALERQAHAHLDLASREHKARKIEQLLDLRPSGKTLRVLEVGTGSGGIAHYFATRSAVKCDVMAVDVLDNRVVRDGYEYRQVDGVELPFDAASFDVVISNHVVEHVGAAEAQRCHVAELHRVLRPDGVAYLAVPNRWMLVEPHYRLAFLSWLPDAWRTPYLRWSGLGAEYDCRPLTGRQARRLLEQAGFDAQQQTGRAVRQAYQLERPQSWAYLLLWSWLPDAVYWSLGPVFPTLIYVLRKSDRRYDSR
ncbi:MAG TPA: methyltransferase domain-containing protein [Lysobacter sp.]